MNKDAELLEFLLDGERDPKTIEAIKLKFSQSTQAQKDHLANSAAFAVPRFGKTMDDIQNKIAKALFG